MEIEDLNFAGLLGIKAPSYEDFRGSFQRLFEFDQDSFNFSVIQASIARNPQAYTFRGLHFQKPPVSESKLILCISGKIQEIVVQVEATSDCYLQNRTIIIGPKEEFQGLFVPVGFAHGYLTLTDDSNLLYFMDKPYDPIKAQGVRWNDPALGLKLIKKPRTISIQDTEWPLLGQS